MEGVPSETLQELLSVKADEWKKELEGQQKFFETLLPDLPPELIAQHDKVAARFAG
jgi:GTP-dependent phosphoenolpyruvate carboxykinase